MLVLAIVVVPLVILLVIAVRIDGKARRRGLQLDVDSASALDASRRNQALGNMYQQGSGGLGDGYGG
jgi:hypothetical protein